MPLFAHRGCGLNTHISEFSMKKHRILVSVEGFTSCPSCKQHMTLDVNALEDVTCPFCGAGMTATLRAGAKGGGVMESLRGSRSGLVAAMLGASLAVGCSGGDDNNSGADMNSQTNNATGADMNNTTGEDMAGDMAEDMAIETTPNNEFVGDYGIGPGNHHTGGDDMGEETDG